MSDAAQVNGKYNVRKTRAQQQEKTPQNWEKLVNIQKKKFTNDTYQKVIAENAKKQQ